MEDIMEVDQEVRKVQNDIRSPADEKVLEMWRQRLDKTPSGAPKHPAVLKLLSLYCTTEQADFLSRMPMTFCSLPQLAKLYKTDQRKVKAMLETLIDKFLVGDLDCGDGVHVYMPLQFIPGFWDMTFMRIRDELPMDEIAHLFERYWDTFYPEVLGQGKPTQDFRVMVKEESLPEKYTEILDYERTSHFIKTADRISVGTCACSSMRMLNGKEVCDRPMETCMALNMGTHATLRTGQAREISKTEAMNIIDDCKAHGMIQCADNVKTEPWYICNCCSCCCHLMEAMRNYDLDTTVVSSNFLARIDSDKCTNCGLCAKACPVQCIEQTESSTTVNEQICLGCGVCVTTCNSRAMKLNKRPRRIYTPDEFNEKFLTLAFERDKLGDQLFYDPNRRSHNAMSKLINTFLKMPPIKQALTINALKSRFLKSIARLIIRDFDKTVQKERIRIAQQKQPD